jgi:UDPglucose 6-dehydrogenase
VWGLTYKKDTHSIKNSPALRLIEELGPLAELHAWDPVIGPADVQVQAVIESDRDDALSGADGLLIMADWDTFGDANLDVIRSRMRRPLVIDCVGVLDPRKCELQGVEYVSMGRPPRLAA